MSEASNVSFDLPSKQKAAMIAALLTGAFMGIINETLLATALPSIQDAFSITQSKVQWMTTAFLLMNGVMIPVSAFLIERFSTRGLFLTAIGLFGVGTVICSIAPIYSILLTGRVVQAAGSGIMLPLLMTVLLAIIPVERRGFTMGLIGVVIAFGPAIGPTLSGFLLEHFAWRSLFFTVLPVVVVTMVVAFLFLKNVTELSKPKVDVLSIILSSVGFGAFLYGFSSVAELGWGSSVVITCVIIGFIVIGLFIWRQLRLKTPMLEFGVFKFSIFRIAIVITMAVLISLIGAETLLPLFMQNVLGFSPMESGLMLLPGACVIGIMSPLTGRLFDKFGAKWLALIGLSIVTITTFMFTNISLETSFTYLTIIYAIRMFGLSFTLMPVMTSALNQLPPKWYSQIAMEYGQRKFDGLEKLITGKSKIVIENGTLHEKNLTKLRMTVDQLEMNLRQKNVTSIRDVEWATLEPSGNLGFTLKHESQAATKKDTRQLQESINQLLTTQQQLQQLTQQLSDINLQFDQENIFKEVKDNGHKHAHPDHLQ